MKTNQDLARLGARTKLFERHLLERKTLLESQRLTRQAAHNLLAGQLALNKFNPQRTLTATITQQVVRLGVLHKSHFEERQQLTTRQRREDAELERVFNSTKPSECSFYG